MIISQHKLPRRVIKQPVPHINVGGDCGSCVLAGVLGYKKLSSGYVDGDNYLFDSPGKAIQNINKEYLEKGAVSLGRWTMIEALYKAVANGLIEEFISDIPMWNLDETSSQFGPSGFAMNLQWFGYIRMAVRAGYYGLAMVDSMGRGGGSREAYGTDHWVLICGFRQRSVKIQRLRNHATLSNARTIKNEILISNSSSIAKDERWIEAPDFLKRFGGYNAILVLPKERDEN